MNMSFINSKRRRDLDGYYLIEELIITKYDIKQEDRKKDIEFDETLLMSLKNTNGEPISPMMINIRNGENIIWNGQTRVNRLKILGTKKVYCMVWMDMSDLEMHTITYQVNHQRQITPDTRIMLGKFYRSEGLDDKEIRKQMNVSYKQWSDLLKGIELSDNVLDQLKKRDGTYHVKGIRYVAQSKRAGVNELGQIELGKRFRKLILIKGASNAEKIVRKTTGELKRAVKNEELMKDYDNDHEKLVTAIVESIIDPCKSSLFFPRDSEQKIPVITKILGDEMFERGILLWTERIVRYDDTNKYHGETAVVLDHVERVAYINTLDWGAIESAREYVKGRDITIIDKCIDGSYCISQIPPSEDRTIIYINGYGTTTYRPEGIKMLKSMYPNSVLITLINCSNGNNRQIKRTEGIWTYGVPEIKNLEHLKELLKEKLPMAEFYDTKVGQCMMVI